MLISDSFLLTACNRVGKLTTRDAPLSCVLRRQRSLGVTGNESAVVVDGYALRCRGFEPSSKGASKLGEKRYVRVA